MNSFNFTTQLNIKIISVMFLLMIIVISYHHWLSLEKENKIHVDAMIKVSDFILERISPDILINPCFAPSYLKSSKDQSLALNQEIQPVFNNIFMPMNIIKFGLYSEKYQRVIAIGPESDSTMFIDIAPGELKAVQQSSVPKLTTEDHSILWYGAKAITYSKPIYKNGVMVGHVFASVNQDMVLASIWKRTLNTFLIAFVMLLFCILIFREFFLRLKNELTSFAESIVTDNANTYYSKFPEFNPVLNYISEQTKKMTSLDRLNIVGEMAAGIAHEIRNPMTTVRGLLQFMQRKKEFINHRENFSLMIDELDRANKIITEFLSLSKDKAFQFQQENLNNIINTICPLLQSNILYNNSILELKLNSLPDIQIDKSSIRQLILNLVKNSLDAMPTGGKITISTNLVDNQIFMSIKDSGIGIPLDIQKKIGTPFFTTKENGTGLGLAICYRIVQRHSASLEIASKPNQGTTCTIKFNARATQCIN